ncbi:MAG: PP2C family protein-serine/threonine phosphatase [Phycisphaerales bacterium]
MKQAGRGHETSEFHHAFRVETDTLMRRRLVWFIAIWGGLGLIGIIVLIANSIAQGGMQWFGVQLGWQQVLFGALTLSWLAAYITALVLVLGKRLSTQDVVRLSIALIVVDGLMFLSARAADIPFYNLSSFWFSHLVACIVFPWRVRESLLPIAIIFPLGVVSALVFEGYGTGPLIASSIALLFALTPGVLLCWYKHSQRLVRASNRFLSDRYGMLRQELAYARQIHEALFPSPVVKGELRFTYKYEPMRQIGGDYLHAQEVRDKDGNLESLSVVVVDVTGHGIPAALTVNRLHGELDLRFADNPDASPGEILANLNRYINLTLARHSIYATALCLRVDLKRGVLEYASGGHPPAFLVCADGTIRELGSTALVLGASRTEEYEPEEVSLAFHPGDSLIVYTDGAVEARGLDGRMMRIAGFRDTVAARLADGHAERLGTWAEYLLDVVTSHRGGSPPEDDTLLVEVHRPLSRRPGEVDAGDEAGTLAPAAGSSGPATGR